jgi:hypothetical protein
MVPIEKKAENNWGNDSRWFWSINWMVLTLILKRPPPQPLGAICGGRCWYLGGGALFKKNFWLRNFCNGAHSASRHLDRALAQGWGPFCTFARDQYVIIWHWVAIQMLTILLWQLYCYKADRLGILIQEYWPVKIFLLPSGAEPPKNL